MVDEAVQFGVPQSVQTGAYLEMLSGPEKGKRIELKSERLSIGREEGNEILSEQEGVSRKHAFLGLSEGDWFIRDNKSKNGVIVNGEKQVECWLADGDIIAMGEFIVRFHAGTVKPHEVDSSMLPSEVIPGVMAESPAEKEAKGRPKIHKRTLIYGSVALVLVLLVVMTQMSPQETPPTDVNRDPSQKLARDFEVSKIPPEDFSAGNKPLAGIEDPLLKRAEQEMTVLDWSDTSLQQAELFFRRGQRDYLEKNYHRAIESFQAALSLYKGHSLAERYLRHSLAEAEDLAKQNLALGVRYFETLQYQRAIYHFRQVVDLLAHRPKEPAVKEAEKYIQQSQLRLRAAELFP